MPGDWFRCTRWTQSDQEEFFARLRRARNCNKAQYLRIQACCLGKEYPSEALRLLDMLLDGFPDSMDRALAYLQKAECLLALSREEEAIGCFRKALQREAEYPHVRTGVSVDYPFYIVRSGRQYLYNEAEEILARYASGLTFPFQRYRYHAAMAIIDWAKGQNESAKEHAQMALSAATEKHSGFRYHPDIGLVEQPDKGIDRQLKRILQARD